MRSVIDAITPNIRSSGSPPSASGCRGRRLCHSGTPFRSSLPVPQFITHAANYHASLVLRQILFRLPAPENRDIIPRATFTDPEIAAVGLGEGRAIAPYPTMTEIGKRAVIAYYAPLTRKPFARAVIRLLRRLG